MAEEQAMQEISMKQVADVSSLVQAGLLLGLFLDPEDESDVSSETSADIQWTTWHYILEDSTLHIHVTISLQFYYNNL